MRITVVFNGTPVLVPCGDGKMTVGELIEKAIVRFKKVAQNKVSAFRGTKRVVTLPACSR